MKRSSLTRFLNKNKELTALDFVLLLVKYDIQFNYTPSINHLSIYIEGLSSIIMYIDSCEFILGESLTSVMQVNNIKDKNEVYNKMKFYFETTEKLKTL